MRKVFILLGCGIAALQAAGWASAASCADVLPQVTLQLSAEEWVTTQSAKVTIALDALLNKGQLAKAQENFQTALKKIAPEGTWHITEFTRTASKTNLEQLHAVAEARLPDSALAGLRDRAHAQNSEGQTYAVQDVLYTPTADEISATQSRLRAQIYERAKTELDHLNAVYPKPGYSLYNINFVNTNIQPGPMMSKMNNALVTMESQAPTANMSLSQQMTQDALVIFASPPGALCK